ncbi:MAG TPA: GIY-YIG nuclease family protein [Allosphingosinicella sp.]|nr:GIY-YIG nuclease family protein [Allosphingosinicella sp.]HYG31206.1 GIY-YIG nuclease family protein [Allosphingosinicella sp.]
MKQPAVYIMASRRNGTVYTGVTSNLVQRTSQHRNLRKGFAGKYRCGMLVWYEVHDEMGSAIAREKQLKGGSRRKKLALIEAMNPEWADLFESIC